ncbi:MAG: cytidylyltransferase domain-containing protein [Treponema sp.]
MNVNEIAVIVQCRLSSSRLPGKALLPLGGKPLVQWTLEAMKRVKAGAYWLAVDEASYDALKPAAEICGYEIFAGPLEDVLTRYCRAIKKIGCKAVIRATGDNPFLFYEAAEALKEEFLTRSEREKVDYMTWTGLPHGSGVEILNADTLLKAEAQTASPYEREHVGPALYNHPNEFNCVFTRAPERFFFPECRTTVDTAADYRRASAAAAYLSGSASPYAAEEILRAFSEPSVRDTALFVPSVQAGRGTGHLRRCLEAALTSGAFVYIPQNPGLKETDAVLSEYIEEGLPEERITRHFPEKGEYSLIAADLFAMDLETAKKLRAAAPLAALDEGSEFGGQCDYLLDIIPSYKTARAANMTEPAFIARPRTLRNAPRAQSAKDFVNVLVCLGGEDPARLTQAAAEYFASPSRRVTAITASKAGGGAGLSGGDGAEGSSPARNIAYVPPVPNLREKLRNYDLVATHYGLTAFEAAAAGCAVILLATSDLHRRLAEKYGFLCLDKKDIAAAGGFEKFDAGMEKLYPKVLIGSGQKNLGAFIQELSHSKRLSCPVCRSEKDEPDKIIARTGARTFRRCADCGMVYMAWTADGAAKEYTKSYFAEQYKDQYGRTYLEDFAAIKEQSAGRVRRIKAVLKAGGGAKPSVLDIGCAYGPFLSAAFDGGLQPYGTDVAEDAVGYVKKTLSFPAVRAHFPAFDAGKAFGVDEFDAVTMWYVIEHFEDLNSVLEKVSSLVKKGGAFAFSTPSGSGVSARFSRQSFFENSPSDHYTIWEPERAAKILKRYGFSVVSTVSTGHHAERFPAVKKHGWKKEDARFRLFDAASRAFSLGDTFEVYCRKEK